MRKRPLCILGFFLLLLIWWIPKDVWFQESDIPCEIPIQVTGIISHREESSEKQIYYLRNCQIPDGKSIPNILIYDTSLEAYTVGSYVAFYGKIYPLNPATNPGQFDQKLYYQSQGIGYTFQVQESRCLTKPKFSFGEAVACFRLHLKKQLSKYLNERERGILSAVFLGDKSILREEDQKLYQKNGISHILAISGLHISMIGMTIYRNLRKRGGSYLISGICSSSFIVFYGMLTGFGVSAKRAIIMFLVLVLGEILGRVYDMASAMALAGILLLLSNPLLAFQASFLLSFGAVCGISMVYPILQKVFSWKQKWFQTILCSISINLVTYPILVHFYYEYPIYSMALNLIVVPLMKWVMIFGFLSLGASYLWLPLSRILSIPVFLVLECYEVLGTWILKLPGAMQNFGREQLWQLWLYYGILLLVLGILWYGGKRLVSLGIPLALILVSLRIRGNLEIVMLDVGQGDGIFLRMPSKTTCFIDGGSSNVKKVGEYRILPFLKYQGSRHLDYVIFSHLDTDHISGIEELLEAQEISIGCMLLPDLKNPDENYLKMVALAQEQGIMVKTIGQGDYFLDQDVRIQCLWPEKGRTWTDKNEGSAVLQLSYGDFSMLFTGDLGEAGEKALLEGNVLEDVDVWKVSHHGSKYSGSSLFLTQILPEISLISVSENNSYGHPSTELLERLEKIHSRVYETAKKGAISIWCEKDGTYGVECMLPSGS